jgi:hypothetical protein
MKSTTLLIYYTFAVKKGSLLLGDGDGFDSLEILYVNDEEYKTSYLVKTRKLKRNLLDTFIKQCDTKLNLEGSQLMFTSFNCVHSITTDYS